MLNPFSFYLIVQDDHLEEFSLLSIINCAVDNGVTAVQLRVKNSSTKRFIELGKKIKILLASKGIPLIINDRVDVALAVGAEGVHIGQSDMPYGDARKILGKEAILGLTVENFDQAIEGSTLDVDYLGLSAVYATPTKPEAIAYWNLEKIKLLREKTSLKLIGVGGIDDTNAISLLKAGLDGVVLSSYICKAPSLEEVSLRSKKLRTLIEKNHA